MLYPSALVSFELNHNRTSAQLHKDQDGWIDLYMGKGSVYLLAVVNRCIPPYRPDFYR